MGKIKLLDCTLRDGGYVNDWQFGHNNIVNIFERLVSAGVDIIEVGFLDERREYDFSRTIMPNSRAVEKIFASVDAGTSMLVGMIDYGTCSLENIIPCEESILDGIRVIFKKHLRKEAMEFCGELKEKGYKVFAQLVSITSYGDDELLDLISLANRIEPYAVSIVDTYGLLHQENLKHYFTLLNGHLNANIAIGYHSHNNFQMAYANCIEFLAQKVERDMVLDGTIYGMGKSAGNAPTELLTMHMNQHYEKNYDTSQLLEAIDSSVMEFYKKTPWGYNMFYYISASNDCHPSYVSYLMNKRTLSVKSISQILDGLQSDKKLLYDEAYIEHCYIDYQTNEINDTDTYEKMAPILRGRSVLVLGPGKSIQERKEDILEKTKGMQCCTFAINFVPDLMDIQYLFLTNAKRYLMLSSRIMEELDGYEIVATSNVTSMKDEFAYNLNYGSLLDYEASIVDNSLLMLLKVLKRVNVKEIYLAGFDGYIGDGVDNYIEKNMEYIFTQEQADEINFYVKKVINDYKKSIPIYFVTDSLYQV